MFFDETWTDRQTHTHTLRNDVAHNGRNPVRNDVAHNGRNEMYVKIVLENFDLVFPNNLYVV